MTRETLRRRLNMVLDENRHIICASVPNGLTASNLEKCNLDMMIASPSARFYHMGRPLLSEYLPYGNANECVMEYGTREILPLAAKTPVIFSLFATDPEIEIRPYIQKIKNCGFSGVMNYPSMGIFSERMQEAFCLDGITYEDEVGALIKASNEGLFSIAVVYDQEEARRMIQAGADMLFIHFRRHKDKVKKRQESLLTMLQDINMICETVNEKRVFTIFDANEMEYEDIKFVYDNTGVNGCCIERPREMKAMEPLSKEILELKKLDSLSTDLKLFEALHGLDEKFDYIKFVKHYVSEHYMESISFNDIVSMAHVSRNHLSYLMKNQIGCTFTEYLRRYRINKAIEIFASKNLSLSEIAILVGFCDYSHFSRSFKQIYNVSPRDYLKKYNKQNPFKPYNQNNIIR